MAIARRENVFDLSKKLPASRIYLDDLEEIISALKPDDDDQPPKLKFYVNDLVCDTIDDLKEIGGRTSKFSMLVAWPKSLNDRLEVSTGSRARIYPDGSAQRRTWAISRVKDIFKRRSSPLKATLLIFGIAAAYLVSFWTVMYFVHRTWGTQGPIHAAFVFGWAVLVFYPLFMLCICLVVRSVVVLQFHREQQGSWFQRHRDQILLHAVTSLISGIIGAAIALFVKDFLSQK